MGNFEADTEDRNFEKKKECVLRFVSLMMQKIYGASRGFKGSTMKHMVIPWMSKHPSLDTQTNLKGASEKSYTKKSYQKA